jgi:hypothetical protein
MDLVASSSSNFELTEEQKERIRLNREEALKRRKAAEERLILQQIEQQKTLEKGQQKQERPLIDRNQTLNQQKQQINIQPFQQQFTENKNKSFLSVEFKFCLLSSDTFKV